MKMDKIAIIGMGPAGLMAATQLAQHGYEVHLFDHKRTAGRKFLVAGKGGFNLTHNEQLNNFISRYNHDYVKDAVLFYTNKDFIQFLNQSLRIETFVGSSNRVFPIPEFKPIDVLNAWLSKLKSLNVHFHFQFNLIRINHSNNELVFNSTNNDEVSYVFNNVLFALGGSSWSKTGSDGSWLNVFASDGFHVKSFQASNTGFNLDGWKPEVLEGDYIKNALFSLGDKSKRGDVVITRYGLEGGPTYFLGSAFRDGNCSLLKIDLKPDFSIEQVVNTLKNAKNHSVGLVHLKLSKSVIQLLKNQLNRSEYMNPFLLATAVKCLCFKIVSQRSIKEAISTVGGLDWCEVNSDFSLKKNSNWYVCGEMLDWDAPTGGYLIQGCVSTAFRASSSLHDSINLFEED
jgi:uncharacterized flavoprotein (TIGR03862 family)